MRVSFPGHMQHAERRSKLLFSLIIVISLLRVAAFSEWGAYSSLTTIRFTSAFPCRILRDHALSGQSLRMNWHRQARIAAAAGGRSGDLQDAEAAALETLAASALTRDSPPQEVFDAIRTLEQAKDRSGKSGFEPLLTGDWRLIYTTGTKKTENEIGRVNYVPITAVQRFDMENRFIRNGIYIGPVSLEFEGTLRWLDEKRRLEFDFEDLKLCGYSLPLPGWLRGKAGMKSETPYNKQPAFNFVVVDSRVAAARGAGGGIALWLRNELAQ